MRLICFHLQAVECEVPGNRSQLGPNLAPAVSKLPTTWIVVEVFIRFISIHMRSPIQLYCLLLMALLAQVQVWAERRFGGRPRVSSNFEGSKQTGEIVPCCHHAARRKLPICCRDGGVRETCISTYVCLMVGQQHISFPRPANNAFIVVPEKSWPVLLS
jgi:hypothetical protein